MCGVSFQRVRKDCREKGCLSFGQFFCGFVEIMLACGFYAIDAVSEFNHVEIHLHNPFFAPECFYKYCLICFKRFSYVTPAVPEKDVFGCLLADGAGSSRRFACSFGFLTGYFYLFEIEAVVRQKAVVFGCNHGSYHVGRDVLYVHPIFFQSDLSVVGQGLLYAAFNHEKCNGRIDKDIQNGCQDAQPYVCKTDDACPFEHFPQKTFFAFASAHPFGCFVFYGRQNYKICSQNLLLIPK